MKKQNAKVENEVKVEKETNVENMSMFDLMKCIEHNTKKIERLSMKIDKLQNLNEELKSQLKTMIEEI